jgi:hypothetical protein
VAEATSGPRSLATPPSPTRSMSCGAQERERPRRPDVPPRWRTAAADAGHQDRTSDTHSRTPGPATARDGEVPTGRTGPAWPRVRTPSVWTGVVPEAAADGQSADGSGSLQLPLLCLKAGLRAGLVPRPVLGRQRHDGNRGAEPCPSRPVSLLAGSGQSMKLTRTRRWDRSAAAGPVHTGVQRWCPLDRGCAGPSR